MQASIPCTALCRQLPLFDNNELSTDILPELPVAEVIVRLKGAEQFIAGWSLYSSANEMHK